MYILGRRASSSRSIGFASRSHEPAGGLLTYSGDGHLITFAPTGTGKTSGPVITNALTHPGQLIVMDIKGEVYAATAEARRAMGQEVHVLDLRDGHESGSLNPLDLLRGTDKAAMGRGFAAEIIERSGNERDPFWNDFAESVIAGGIAWLLADCRPKVRTLSHLFDLFVSPDVDHEIAVGLDSKTFKERSCRAAFTAYMQLSSRETRPGVLGTTVSHLRLFDSDLVRRLTNSTSFDADAFIEGEPMSLYIIVPPMRLAAYRPLLRLWLTGMILAMTSRTVLPQHRTLILCDEIGNIGRISAFVTASTLMRSWGLTIWSFWQNVSQIQHYGTQANTLVDNAAVLQIFGAKNFRMAQDLANLIGDVSPEQIMKLKPDEQLLLIDGKLTKARQARYYSDPLFVNAEQAASLPSRSL